MQCELALPELAATRNTSEMQSAAAAVKRTIVTCTHDLLTLARCR